MINNLFKVLLLATIIVSSFAYVYIIPPEIGKSIDHDGHCYYDREKVLLRIRESKHLKNCEQISCNDDYSMTLFGCGTYSVNDPNCKRFERDLSKPYPLCCTALICVEYEKNPTTSDDDLMMVESNTLD